MIKDFKEKLTITFEHEETGSVISSTYAAPELNGDDECFWAWFHGALDSLGVGFMNKTLNNG